MGGQDQQIRRVGATVTLTPTQPGDPGPSVVVLVDRPQRRYLLSVLPGHCFLLVQPLLSCEVIVFRARLEIRSKSGCNFLNAELNSLPCAERSRSSARKCLVTLTPSVSTVIDAITESGRKPSPVSPSSRRPDSKIERMRVDASRSGSFEVFSRRAMPAISSSKLAFNSPVPLTSVTVSRRLPGGPPATR